MFNRPAPVHKLPDNYRQDYYLSITDNKNLVMLNILSIVLLIGFLVLSVGWQRVVMALRGPYTVETQIPTVLLIIAVLSVLVLHEFIHGITIRWAGYAPRYGMEGIKLGPVTIPYILYATTKHEAYFRRTPYMIIALAPVVVITLVGMVLMIVLPDYVMGYIVGAIVINGAGAVGDLWMTWVLRNYPEEQTLIKDEADAIRVFVRDDRQPSDLSSRQSHPED